MDMRQARNGILRLAVLVEGGLVVLALALGWLVGLSPALAIKWNWFDALRGVVLTIPLLLVGFLLLRWPFGPFRRIKQFTYEILCPLLAPCTRTDLLGISVLAGFGEEMLFRGVFQAVFTRWLNTGLSLLLASALFGILHAVTFTYAVLAFAMGAYLGGIWLLTENLLVPIIAHTLYDFVLLWYLLYGPGIPPQLLQDLGEKLGEAAPGQAESPEGKDPFGE